MLILKANLEVTRNKEFNEMGSDIRKIMDVEIMREEAAKSPCRIIKFSASNGEFYSHNGEFYADCKDCKRRDIEQSYPDCKANHAEWGILSKGSKGKGGITKNIYIYCMTPDGNDYPFKRFWCQTCAILLPMFGIKDVYMWNGNEWIWHDSKKLIEEVNGNITQI